MRSEIAAFDAGGGGRPNAYTSAAERQQNEIERTSAYARSMGCDRREFSFFGGQAPQQCAALNARIRSMQANLAQLQNMSDRAGGSYGSAERQNLVARYNAYCRSQPRGFFESLFGGSNEPVQPAITDDAPPPSDEDRMARGGSQAICVRSCDGGFFPLNYSARRDTGTLTDLCHALCPNAETALYTRNPDNEVGTAVSSDGRSYRDLENAFKFQKSFDPACTCKPKSESWVQALTQSDAEHVLGQERKGDIIVTPEKSLEMSRPKMDLSIRAKMPVTDSDAVLSGKAPQTSPPQASTPTASTKADPKTDARLNAASAADQTDTQEITGPDGVKRRVRKVGPTP